MKVKSLKEASRLIESYLNEDSDSNRKNKFIKLYYDRFGENPVAVEQHHIDGNHNNNPLDLSNQAYFVGNDKDLLHKIHMFLHAKSKLDYLSKYLRAAQSTGVYIVRDGKVVGTSFQNLVDELYKNEDVDFKFIWNEPGSTNESFSQDKNLSEALWNEYRIDFIDTENNHKYSEEYQAWNSREAISLFRADYPQSEGYKFLKLYKLTDEGYEEVRSLDEDVNDFYTNFIDTNDNIEIIDEFLNKVDVDAHSLLDYKNIITNLYDAYMEDYKKFPNSRHVDSLDIKYTRDHGRFYKKWRPVIDKCKDIIKKSSVTGYGKYDYFVLKLRDMLKNMEYYFPYGWKSDASLINESFDHRTNLIFCVDKYLANNPDSDRPVGYIGRRDRGYDDLVTRYGDYTTTPFRYVSDDELEKFVKAHNLCEDYQHIDDEWGEPYTYKEVEDDLKSLTNNWQDKDGIVRCYWEQEKEYGKQILQQHYDVVEISDGRTGKGENMSWAISYAKPKQEIIV